MKAITLKEVEHLAFSLAQEHLAFDEPIPDFSTRYPNKLESCVAMPFMKFDGKYLYGSLIERASILFYLIIKNHPFQNGNKRIAMTTLFVFLCNNSKWMEIDARKLYNFTVWVAQSPAELKDEVVKGIEKYIKAHISDLDKQKRKKKTR